MPYEAIQNLVLTIHNLVFNNFTFSHSVTPSFQSSIGSLLVSKQKVIFYVLLSIPSFFTFQLLELSQYPSASTYLLIHSLKLQSCKLLKVQCHLLIRSEGLTSLTYHSQIFHLRAFPFDFVIPNLLLFLLYFLWFYLLASHFKGTPAKQSSSLPFLVSSFCMTKFIHCHQVLEEQENTDSLI